MIGEIIYNDEDIEMLEEAVVLLSRELWEPEHDNAHYNTVINKLTEFIKRMKVQ